MLVPAHNAPEPGPLGLGSGAFSRSWSKIIGQKKGTLYLGRGLPPFYWLRVKWQRVMHVQTEIACKTRVNRPPLRVDPFLVVGGWGVQREVPLQVKRVFPEKGTAVRIIQHGFWSDGRWGNPPSHQRVLVLGVGVGIANAGYRTTVLGTLRYCDTRQGPRARASTPASLVSRIIAVSGGRPDAGSVPSGRPTLLPPPSSLPQP
jgi:hypothetical protein